LGPSRSSNWTPTTKCGPVHYSGEPFHWGLERFIRRQLACDSRNHRLC
jgi:hypothetical protein